jgi:hypothetical protein
MAKPKTTSPSVNYPKGTPPPIKQPNPIKTVPVPKRKP